MLRILVIWMAAIFITGCSSIETKVSSFHALDFPLSGVTFSIVPVEEQLGSLEFQTYAKLVKAELEKHGMVDKPIKEAKYAVFVVYGIDNGKTVMSTYPIFGQTGISSSNTSGSATVYGNSLNYQSTMNRPGFGGGSNS